MINPDAKLAANIFDKPATASTREGFGKGVVEAGKAVFAAEYTDTGSSLDQFCPQAKAMQFSAVLKNRELDAYREACP